MKTDTTHELPCPHPDCNATLRVKDYIMAGEYTCHCGGCVVKLAWAAYQAAGRKPYLTLARTTLVQPGSAQEPTP